MRHKAWRLVKFCLAALIIYFAGKVPFMLLMTEVLHVHYVISGAIAGAFITLLQFIPSEFWIWNKKQP